MLTKKVVVKIVNHITKLVEVNKLSFDIFEYIDRMSLVIDALDDLDYEKYTYKRYKHIIENIGVVVIKDKYFFSQLYFDMLNFPEGDENGLFNIEENR